MILNPKTLNCVDAPESQYQPNGVDLRVDAIWQLAEDAVFTMSENKDDKISTQVKDNTEQLDWEWDDKGHYILLSPGKYYLFDSIEWVDVPENASGKIIHRSSSNRASMRIESGWYDSGYKGFVGGSITVNVPIKLYRGTRIAQIIMWESDSNGNYNGQWQGSNTLGEQVNN
jgi:deoxycytidine triphosphate deaminase